MATEVDGRPAGRGDDGAREYEEAMRVAGGASDDPVGARGAAAGAHASRYVTPPLWYATPARSWESALPLGRCVLCVRQAGQLLLARPVC